MHPLLADQAGVISRRQLLAAGHRPHDVARMIRRRELVPLHPGVYVDHTGAPTEAQLGWAAVLACWPAALSHTSALRAHEGWPAPARAEIHVVVPRDHTPVRRPGITVHRTAHLDTRVMWHLAPPRVRYADALLDVAASARTESDAVAVLAAGVGGRRTTPSRLRAALADRPRIARRTWLDGILADVEAGACSVLEREYLRRVERPHGLTGARRQVRDRAGDGVIYRDVEYDGGCVVELDGRLHHGHAAARDRDAARDLVSAADGKRTIRITYGLVLDRACFTAEHVGRFIGQRARRCGPGCGIRS